MDTDTKVETPFVPRWKKKDTVALPSKPVIAEAWLQPAKDALVPAGELRRVQDALIITARSISGDADTQDLLVKKVQEIRDLQTKIALEQARWAVTQTGINHARPVDEAAFYEHYVNTHGLPPSIDLGETMLPPTEPNGQQRRVRLNDFAATAILRQTGALPPEQRIVDRMRESQQVTKVRLDNPMTLYFPIDNGMNFVVRTDNASLNRQDNEPVGLTLEFGLGHKNSNAAKLLYDTATLPSNPPPGK